MQKLTEQNNKNSALEYDKIFLKRKENGIDEQDLKRWKKLLKFYKGGRLIDLGCLDSEIPGLIKQRFPEAEVWGIDLAQQAITQMQQKFPWVYYEVMDVYKTKYPDNYFGYIVAGELIEHLEFPEEFIKEGMRILRPGGIFALSTPKEEIKDIGAIDKERHLWSFSEDDIENLFSPYGSVKIEFLKSQYFPIYKYRFPTLISWIKKY